MSATRNHFLYLNRDNRWRDFSLEGLVLSDEGHLRLFPLPHVDWGTVSPEQRLELPENPAGIAVAPDGSVFFTDPHDVVGGPDRRFPLWMIGCDARATPIPCLLQRGSQRGQLHTPRGLLYHRQRDALVIADSGNHCVYVFDPQTWQLLGIWDADGELQQPWALAADDLGDVYIVDHGTRRVRKVDSDGRLIHAFDETLQDQSTIPVEPVGVAIGEHDGTPEVYVLDAGAKSVYVYRTDGTYLRSLGSGQLKSPLALAVDDGLLYVGEINPGRILVLTLDDRLVGEASGVRGDVTGLALDDRGGLLIHPGGWAMPLRATLDGANARSGRAWGGPFHNPSDMPQSWHMFSSTGELPPGAHMQLLVYASPTETPLDVPDWDQASDLEDCLRSGDWEQRWIRMPLDAQRGVVSALQAASDAPGGSRRLSWLWFAVEFMSDGRATPSLEQVRIDFDVVTPLQHLPAIYRKDAESRQFLERYLALLESGLSDVEDEIADLARLSDPAAIDVEDLSWLASWLAVPPDRYGQERDRRDAIAGAFEAYGWAGTIEGLRASVRRYAGVEILIEEPLLQTNWWSLATEDAPDVVARASILGVSTVLVASDPQGAVVGTTAMLDGSRLITDEEFGAPLFDDVAYRFSAHLYRGAAYSTEALDDVRAVIDREKPAHTVYEVCVIEPTMRVGFQSRIGIDAIVAGPPEPMTLDDPRRPSGLLLGGEPQGQIGTRAQLGRTSLIGGDGLP